MKKTAKRPATVIFQQKKVLAGKVKDTKNDAIANQRRAEEFLFTSQPVDDNELHFPDVEYAFPQDQELQEDILTACRHGRAAKNESGALKFDKASLPTRKGNSYSIKKPACITTRRASSPRFMPYSAFQSSYRMKGKAKNPSALDPGSGNVVCSRQLRCELRSARTQIEETHK